jgi:hypothetical protein
MPMVNGKDAFEVRRVVEALLDERVQRSLALALRDAQIRRQFRQLRREMTVALAVERLAEGFCLSEERIRTIVYRKG